MKTPLTMLSLIALLGPVTPVLAEEPAPVPPWAATLRAGAFVLRSPLVVGHPAGPVLELSLGRTLYEQVSVEVSAGQYRTDLVGTGTRLTVSPVSVSLRLAAPPENGFEAFAVAGLGVARSQFSGGSLAAASTWGVAYHAGLGIRRQFGEALFAGLEGRYVFQDAPAQATRLDGLRLLALAGLRF